MDAVWSGSGDLALREPPAELCLLSSQEGTSENESRACRAWGPGCFSSEQGITLVLVQIYRNIITWPGLDLRKGSTPPGSLDTSSCPSLPLPRKGLCWELLGSLGFRSWATCLPGGPTWFKSSSAPKADISVSFGPTGPWGTETCVSVTHEGRDPASTL